MRHPLFQFIYCPVCGEKAFEENNEKSKKCTSCGFIYYFNPSAAVACFIRNHAGEILIAKRAYEPAKGTYDLPGGFVDMYENAEETVTREIKEETGLTINTCRYLFSLPNIYPYKGFDVHTLDLYYECTVESFEHMVPQDDVSALLVLRPENLNPEDFGLLSIRKAVQLYNQRV